MSKQAPPPSWRHVGRHGVFPQGKLDDATWKKLFTDLTPADLSAKAKPFPIAPYFNDILESYEKKVAN